MFSFCKKFNNGFYSYLGGTNSVNDLIQDEDVEKETAFKNARLSSKDLFELGQLYANTGDIDSAIPKLVDAARTLKAQQDIQNYLKAQNLLLKIYANRLDFEKVNDIKEDIQDLVLKENIQLTSRTFYTLGICAAYKGQTELALDYFQKALAEALTNDDKEDMCFAINGVAMCYYHLGKYQEALKELYNLHIFFEVLDLPHLKMSSQIVNALVLRKLERFDQAIDVLWDAYADLKKEYSIRMYFNILYALGSTYYESGNGEMAKLYLLMIKKSIDPKNFKQTLIQVDSLLEKLGGNEVDEYDIIFDAASNSITEKRKGKVNFKNQFILLDLLHLFIKNPGKVFSKEELVRRVWNQEYNPSVHDNKVYVTIKRLRKLIEPDYDKPNYIFRAKNGYYLNKGARVHIESEN